MVGVYQIKRNNNWLYKYLNLDNEIGYRLSKRLRKRKWNQIFRKIIESSRELPWIGTHIATGQCLNKIGSYRSPFIIGFHLESIPWNQLNITELVSLSCAIDHFIFNLRNYTQKYSLTGDWALHNIMFDGKRIINVDLEGFFTYSQIGLSLDWEVKENSPSYLIKHLRGIQPKIFQNYKPSRCYQYITIIHQSNGFALFCPGRLEFQFPLEISGKIIHLDLLPPHNDIPNKQTQPKVTYYCYISCKGGNPHSLITTKQVRTNNSNKHWKQWFTFMGIIPNHHTQQMYLDIKANPTRTVLSSSKEPVGLPVSYYNKVLLHTRSND